MRINPYSVLGVSEDASIIEIKKAYRVLALKYHPDKAHNSEDKFYKIKESYGILMDPVRKREIDMDLLVDKPKPKSRSSRRPVRGSDLLINIKATTEELQKNKIINIKTVRKGKCPSCNGNGTKSGNRVECGKCGGTGIDPVSSILGGSVKCVQCNGQGDIIKDLEKCPKCAGTGLIREIISEQVELGHSSTIVLKGLGNYVRGGMPGNLIVDIDEKVDKLYRVRGRNVYRTLTISPALAILGGEIFIVKAGSRISIKIAPGTQHGSSTEIKGAGVLSGGKRGNLIIKFKVEIPDPFIDPRFSDGKLRKLYKQILSIENKRS